MKKKYIRTTIVVIVLAVLGVAYFYYLSNRPSSQDATEKSVNDATLARLTTIDLTKNYPESPKAVTELYLEISKMFYADTVKEEDIEKLGKQARILFDDELKSKQSQDEYLAALKAEVKRFKDAKRVVSDYKIENSQNVNYQELNGKSYASILSVYYIRENSKLLNSYTRFTLRKDNQGKWKILYWELVNDNNID